MANHNQYKSVLVDRFEEFHPLSTQEWGFTHGKSITGTLLTATDNWHRLDSGFDTCAVFFDFSKAFDTVPHRPLLQKLKDLKFHSHILKWLTHYLSFRHQCVCVNSSLSDILPVYSGVPQGSVLQWRSQAGAHWGTCPSNWGLCPTSADAPEIIGAECHSRIGH